MGIRKREEKKKTSWEGGVWGLFGKGDFSNTIAPLQLSYRDY